MNERFRHTRLADLYVFGVPVVKDHRGNLAFLQWRDMPFDFKRVYYIFDIPSGARRGGHAHIRQQEVLIAVSGSFDVVVDDGHERRSFTLNNPEKALYIPQGIWREIENFSANSICLVLNNEEFDEGDYIRDYAYFMQIKNGRLRPPENPKTDF
ncbi:MAG: WxcM-like domain-containing protein [Chlorobi bacterium]|nr:WxcM-like domain-containing protein [Chlorobiota bacterium]